MIRPALALLLVITLCPGWLRGEEPPRECRDLIASFFTSLRANDATRAVTELMADKGKWGVQTEFPKIIGVLQGMNESTVGKLHDHQIVAIGHLGPDYLIMVVMARYDRQPLFFRFAFYRAQDRFTTDTLNMNSNVGEVFGEWIRPANLTVTATATATEARSVVP
jgi:hypothetical protein